MNEKNLRRLKKVFYALIVIFILIMVYMFLMGGDIQGIMRMIIISTNFALWGLFFLLGAILIFLVLKSKVKGKLKVFLLLTGVSSVGFLIGVVLHNAFYALGIIFEHITILKYLMEIFHVVFFFIAIPICPILFLIGVIGSIVLFKRKGN